VECPVELSVNTNRLFMEGLHSLLDLRFRNRSGAERFRLDVRLKCRLLTSGGQLTVDLLPGATRRRSLDLYLPRPQGDQPGCAGYAHFDVGLTVKSEDEGDHFFRGEFTLNVLAHAENRQQVNISIDKIIEQHGKGGMGAINEVDLSDFVRLPAHLDVNELIGQHREPRFTEISLEYRGAVARDAPPVLPRGVAPLDRCHLVSAGGGSSLLVLASEWVVLGRSRENADIVTWVMPRSEENDYRSRMISSTHCRLLLNREGLWLEHLSRSNPSHIDGEPIERLARIPSARACELQLGPGFALLLDPVPCSTASDKTLRTWREAAGSDGAATWEWSEDTGVGGLLITRRDGLAETERYLWLFSHVPWPLPGSQASGEVLTSLVAIAGGLALANATSRLGLMVSGLQPSGPSAVPLAEHDQCTDGRHSWLVHPYEQDLDSEA
jgi:hypothetical protein